MQFSQTVAAQLSGRVVACLPLVFMDFLETPRRWAPGFGTLTTNDGEVWRGTGEMITIDGLEEDIGVTANPMTFTLSGVDPELVTLARNASARVKGRRVVVYIQFFTLKDWQPLDNPYVLKVATMDQMRYIADGPSARTIIVTAEGLWTGRNRPAFGLYTDRDQNARFPGDRGFEQIGDLATKTVRWPG